MENIKTKIQKLFALVERGVGGEAENAMRMANELLAKYDLKEFNVKFTEQDVLEKAKIKKWVKLLLNACAINCGVLFLNVKEYENGKFINRAKLIGDELGINVTIELFKYLEDYVRRNTTKGLKGTERRKYQMSLAAGVMKKLKENEGVWRDGLSKRNKIVEEYKKENPNTKHRTEKYDNSNQEAFNKGMDVNLSKQTAGVNETLKIEALKNGTVEEKNYYKRMVG